VARSPRIDRPGAWHHVMHRGARREPIFRGDEHCLLFLGSIDEAVAHHGLELHAYSLMPNHYHLLVRTPLGNLSRCMRHVNATYTQRLNLRHGWDGPVFRGRFRSQIIEEERYLDQVFAYIHLNPFRAGLAARLDQPSWTSLRVYLGKDRAPGWLCTDHFSRRFGGREGIEEAIRLRRKRADRWAEDMDEMGWIRARDRSAPSDDALRARLVEARRPTIEEVLARVASIAGCTVATVKRREMGPGANPARRLAVWALSRAQAYSHREIASALRMSEGQVAKVLWRLRRDGAPARIAAWMAPLTETQVESGRS
jgi:putative transposase